MRRAFAVVGVLALPLTRGFSADASFSKDGKHVYATEFGKPRLFDIDLSNQSAFSPRTFQEIAKRYSEAFALYQGGRFRDAESCFRVLSKHDTPSAVLAQRCAELLVHQLPEWNGVFVMTEK
jgi:hypothetical protein